MKHFCLLETINKKTIQLIASLFVATLLTANFAYAQVPGGGKGKASLQLLEKMDAGTSQDFIVVYDDNAIQKETLVLQSIMELPARHYRIVELKAARYAEKKEEVHSAFGSHEATVLKHYSHLPLSFVRIHSREALAKLLAQPGVAGVYEDRVERLALAESLPLIGQPQAAAQGNQGAGTTVAVLDTGADYTLPAFGSCTSPGVPANCKVVYAQDFALSDGQLDNDGHGTNVAGIVLGVAPGTKIVALDVFSGSTASSSDIIDAINWVIANKATYNIVAINLSLGSDPHTSPVTDGLYNVVVNQARAAGILTIAAAGNDGYTNALLQPAATTGVISVGAVYDSQMGSMAWGICQDATTFADKVTCFSNSASFLTLLAPGAQILAAGVTEGGTSQAAPHVAGAVAVLRAAFPSETLNQTVARLTNGVMVTDSKNGITKPRLNLQKAIGVTASCVYAISETSKSFGSNSSTGSIAVTAGAGCTWTASSSASWLTVTSGNSGSGNGTVSYALQENPNTSSRTGTLTVAGKTYTVTQSGACVYAISETSKSFGSNSSTGSIVVTTGAGCTWTAASSASWLTVTSGNSGSGNDTVSYALQENPNTSSRTGTLTVAGKTYTVTQSGSIVSPITAIDAGGRHHTCALTTAGGVKCWGINGYGQLGDNTTTIRLIPVNVRGLASGVTAIAAGTNHTCALTTAGGVKCWGYNGIGQLGDNTNTDRKTPVGVVGLASGVAAIAAGATHTCALTTAGGVKCWGHNYQGKLGDNTQTHRLTPVDVSGLNGGVVAITANNDLTCALTTAGGVKCWGYNFQGQLGDNTTTNRLKPVDVAALASGVAAITAGDYHTCALTTAGGVKCWGANFKGQLGDNTITNRLTPVNVTGLASGVAAIAAGTNHTCALTTVGRVKCWGNNFQGQLGDNTTTDRWTPVDVASLASGMSAITAGSQHTCALTTAGGVMCWGFNSQGQLGDNTQTTRLTPVNVAGLGGDGVAPDAPTNITVTTGNGNAVISFIAPVDIGSSPITSYTATSSPGGLTGSCTAPCSSITINGLTNGTAYTFTVTATNAAGTGAPAVALSSVSAIAAGDGHTCALTTAGWVKCWGMNDHGQLGDNTTTNRLTPVYVALASGAAAIAPGTNHTCALTTTGGIKCWGYNGSGQLGDNTTTERWTPVYVMGLDSGVAAITASLNHTCALTTAGGVKCWGRNNIGQLGDNTQTTRFTPVDVTGLASGVAAIAAGTTHTCALTTAGGVKCWGHNYQGKLGDNSTKNYSLIPVNVRDLASGVAAITAGSDHTCALTTAGGVKCWGKNFSGQLGDNTTTERWTPVYVTGLASGVTAIAAGTNHTCALTTAGGVKCWGYNGSGQLGDNTLGDHRTPVDVSGLASGMSGITAGSEHTCALTTAGGVKCWGRNNIGQLGDNTTTDRRTPVDVAGLGSDGVAPDAPTNITVTTGNGSAVISFIAPVDIGSSPITSYTATSSPGGLKGFCTAPCSSITINGLTNGTAYTFTVTANNAAGAGAPSAALGSVTPTAQGIDHVPRVQRAFVASNGVDTNITFNCDTAHPCRTFYTAVAVVDTNGEVVALNSAGYGVVTLTRSISLTAAPGVYAGISVSPGTTGVMIATPGVNVVLRGLTINGQGGASGVLMSAGSKLSIENCVISNFNGTFPIGVYVHTAATVRIVNTLVRDSAIGMAFLGGAMVDISKSKLLGNDSGILMQSAAGITSTIAISHSVIAGGGTGIDVSSSTSGNAQVNIVRSAVTNNAVKGIVASATVGTASVTLNKSLVSGNAIGFYKGAGGTLNSLGNNTITDNGSNTGTLTLITPK